MKKLCAVSGVILALTVVGCSSPPLNLAQVGPNPAGQSDYSKSGQLQVFSVTHTERDGNEYDINPAWQQHADYGIYTADGRHRIRYVSNSIGKYAQRPALVSLPAGRYIVRTEDRNYETVNVPVVIEVGRTTRVHLDGAWQPPTRINVVTTPSGSPVGWRSN